MQLAVPRIEMVAAQGMNPALYRGKPSQDVFFTRTPRKCTAEGWTVKILPPGQAFIQTAFTGPATIMVRTVELSPGRAVRSLFRLLLLI